MGLRQQGQQAQQGAALGSARAQPCRTHALWEESPLAQPPAGAAAPSRRAPPEGVLPLGVFGHVNQHGRQPNQAAVAQHQPDLRAAAGKHSRRS